MQIPRSAKRTLIVLAVVQFLSIPLGLGLAAILDGIDSSPLTPDILGSTPHLFALLCVALVALFTWLAVALSRGNLSGRIAALLLGLIQISFAMYMLFTFASRCYKCIALGQFLWGGVCVGAFFVSCPPQSIDNRPDVPQSEPLP